MVNPLIYHITERISKCRQAMFSNGFKNEELCPTVKAQLWKSIGIPSLLYSVCTDPITAGEMQLLESFQDRMVKSSLYLSKSARHSNIMSSFGISYISHVIAQRKLKRLDSISSLYRAVVILFVVYK